MNNQKTKIEAQSNAFLLGAVSGCLLKVDDIKRPLIRGEKFLVPCLVKTEVVMQEEQEEQEIWLDLTNIQTKKVIYVLPIIDHPHNDIENGQIETHYHLDYRFINHKKDSNFPTIKKSHSLYIFGSEIRPKKDFGNLEYHLLPVINEDFNGITPVNFIKKSKLKHKCVHKGKCPHRGYDLSQVKAINGIITCPLHGLKFNSLDGAVVNFKP